MKYKKIWIVALLLLPGISELYAQQITPKTLNNGGQSRSAGSIVVEDALGGFSVCSINANSFLLTQDFLQPDAGTTTIIPVINNIVLSTGSGLDNAGTTFMYGNLLLEFTTGEFASTTLNSSSNMLTQGILQPFSFSGTLPVVGLEFYAMRLSSTTVQLDWKTVQEINNKGFHIERKKENESGFASIGFVNSNANGGNSNISLQYQKMDNNNFKGITYYRLKQEDLDGRSTYSAVRIVKSDPGKELMIQIWPVPAVSYFNIIVSGLAKSDVIHIMDMSGRIVKQFVIQNQLQKQVNGLLAGTYFVKLASDTGVGQKVIVQ